MLTFLHYVVAILASATSTARVFAHGSHISLKDYCWNHGVSKNAETKANFLLQTLIQKTTFVNPPSDDSVLQEVESSQEQQQQEKQQQQQQQLQINCTTTK
eukprot:TRINITY_DN3170_c0_g1_i7.p1 TRINITY_DN3170_c0_g1~~TRINITY_DN3170_c0_g1_i7.p1  ORF type:complete len:101 (-),score=20.69 TRINITY_DN3170_c0_g1_i7:152-454(-)